MVSYYRINVSKNGKYLFATENAEHGGGICYAEHAQEVLDLFKEKFPLSEGYKVDIMRYEVHLTHYEEFQFVG